MSAKTLFSNPLKEFVASYTFIISSNTVGNNPPNKIANSIYYGYPTTNKQWDILFEGEA